MSRAKTLTDHFGHTVIAMEWGDREKALAGVHLLVNTTTLGMAGKPALDITFAGMADEAVVTDIVYAPLQTPLLAAARAAGYKTVDGLGMLLHQAQPGFKAWFGKMPEVDNALRDHVLAGIANK
jgi:shikimate dehydrogenase